MKSLIAFVIVVGVVLLILLNMHVVKTKTGVIFLRKVSPSLKDTYADISLWQPSDLDEHEGLVGALRARGHQDLVEAIEEKQAEEGRPVSPWAAPAPSPEAVRTGTRTQTGSATTQKRIRDRVKKETGN